MIYRTLVDLDFGDKGIVKKNQLIMSNAFTPEAEKILKSKNKIAPVSAPPLNELKGWKTRAGKLEKVGIMNLAHFLMGDILLLMEVCNASDEKVEQWKTEFRDMLGIPPRQTG